MNKILTTLALLCVIVSANYGQLDPIGIWKNIDDEDGKVKSHIEIYYKDGKIEAKVVKLLENATLTVCTKCKGDKKDQPLECMIIGWDMESDGEKKWKGGKIMNPKSGKEYKCVIELKDENKLKVRGYVGMPAFGRTQYWYRLGGTKGTQ